jgi:hypothetical protein|tara:strand:- start:2239 stop:2424 length:186 start_codon:yes stop_codon:yes gene_type:complete
MNNLFNTQEFQVILQAINALDIKGSDAIYIANLQTKINKTINNLKEKEDKAKDIINLEKNK